jgi:hypothetical protein
MDIDCPVCLEPMIEGNDNCAMNGINCQHNLCVVCYCKITESENKKCPICRVDLTDDSEDSDDESYEIFDGNNDRPTIDLFESRRWLNVETNKIEYFFIYLDQTGFHNSWTDIERKHFPTFISRYLNRDYIEGCCYVCGIQRTVEVNEHMKNKYPNGFHVSIENDIWSDFFIEGYNNCHECYNTFVELNDHFKN